MEHASVVIFDLDNTLFDWVDIWHRSFKAMLDSIITSLAAELSDVSRDDLLRDFKAVFTQHGTTEYAFAIQELASLTSKHPGEDLAVRYSAAIDAYRTARNDALKLFPDVQETLDVLKDKKCLLVGYTESMAYYTHYRMRKLGLDRLLDYIYSPEDHDLPNSMTPEQIRAYPPDRYELRRTEIRHTPKGELKPSPKVLLDIISEIGALPDEVVYVGDSLMKDVLMARGANVSEVWAKYGVAQNRPEYELLRAVTHWTPRAVSREKDLTEDTIAPAIVLTKSLSELLTHFHFDAFVDRSPERLEHVLDAWKTTVDVQQHFNELEMKVRNFALTIMAAVFGGAAFSIKEHVRATLFGRDVSMAFLILLAGTAIWLAFYLMDRFWYHQLLIGAVKHGLLVEKRHKQVLPEISLADAIGKASPTSLLGWNIHSSTKLNLFYWFGVALLLVGAIVAQFAVSESPAATPTKASSPGTTQSGTSSTATSAPPGISPTGTTPSPPKSSTATSQTGTSPLPPASPTVRSVPPATSPTGASPAGTTASRGAPTTGMSGATATKPSVGKSGP